MILKILYRKAQDPLNLTQDPPKYTKNSSEPRQVYPKFLYNPPKPTQKPSKYPQKPSQKFFITYPGYTK